MIGQILCFLGVHDFSIADRIMGKYVILKCKRCTASRHLKARQVG